MDTSFKLFVWREDLGDWVNHHLVVARNQDEAQKILLDYLVSPNLPPKVKESGRKYWSEKLSQDWQEINVTINVDKPQVLKELN